MKLVEQVLGLHSGIWGVMLLEGEGQYHAVDVAVKEPPFAFPDSMMEKAKQVMEWMPALLLGSTTQITEVSGRTQLVAVLHERHGGVIVPLSKGRALAIATTLESFEDVIRTICQNLSGLNTG